MNCLLVGLGAALVLSACQDLSDPYPPENGSNPQFTIADGVNGGNPHFYFLPPLVPPPRYSGTFDASLKPVVKICSLPACQSEIIRFTSGSGPDKVSVDKSDEAYRVNWHTKAAGLTRGDRLRVRVLVGQVLLGYLDVHVTPKQGRPLAVARDVVALREGHPLLIKFRIEEGAVTEQPEEAMKLAFTSNRANPTVSDRIYVSDADGANVVRVTQVGGVYDFAWSPDGRKFVFTRNMGTLSFLPNIFVINADGTGETRLTTQPGIGPKWSPDGTRITFGSFGVQGEIFGINADGTSLTNLTNDPASDGGPIWSPDGSQIAFVRSFGFQPELFVMDADGNGQTRLTNDFQYDHEPAWSPDGTTLAFSREWAEGSGPFTGNIWAIKPDGSGAVNLTNFTGQAAAVPAWSPSGDRVAFEGGDPDVHDIYTMNRDGSGLFNVTNTLMSHEARPVWSPDGSLIAFISHKDNHLEVFTIRPDGTGLTNVTNNPADDGGWGYAWKPLRP